MTAAFTLMRAKDMVAHGRHAEAAPLVLDILAKAPRLAPAHLLMAQIHHASGKMGEALDAASIAQQLDPTDPQIASQLAAYFVELKLPEHALPLLRQALEKSPDAFEPNHALALCYFDMEKGRRALPHFEAALAAAPNATQRDAVTLKLAECLAAINESQRSDDLLKNLSATAINPIPAILMRGMGVAKPVSPELVTSLESIAGTPGQDAEAKAQALLALGRIHDLAGRHQQAFDLWRQSRALLGVQQHNKQAVTTRNLQTRGIYSKALLEAAVPYGDPAASPIFIAGMPRSGTTLAAQILAAHPAVVSTGETDRLNKLDVVFRRDHWGPDAAQRIYANARQGSLRALAQELNAFFAVFAEGTHTRIVEKTPTNYESLGFIHLCFPKARFIHCRRHPADNFVSAFQHNMNKLHDYTYDQSAFVERYLAQEEIMAHWKQCFPTQVFDLNYEELVAAPEKVIRRLVAFCDLPWDNACLSFHNRDTTVRTFSRDQVRQPIYTSSVARWRRYEANLETLFAKLNQSAYHYAPSDK